MLQTLATRTMEPPVGHDAEATRDEKAKALRAVRPLDARSAVRGQFRGSRDVDGVAGDSTVETFAAVRLHIDSWRWEDVTFVIRAGKCLPVTAAEALVEFRRPPAQLFGEAEHLGTNHVRFRIQPKVAIAIGARTKTPGEQMVGEDVELSVSDLDPEAMAPYDRLLGDALAGNASLFAREDTVEAAWMVVNPILGDAVPAQEYDPGTWGPPDADRLGEPLGGRDHPAARAAPRGRPKPAPTDPRSRCRRWPRPARTARRAPRPPTGGTCGRRSGSRGPRSGPAHSAACTRGGCE